MALLNYADVSSAITNVVALQKEITADVATILGFSLNGDAAFPYMRYQNGTYPKWLNMLTNTKPSDFGVAQNEQPYSLLMELQLGKITQGYDGQLEQQFYTWIPYTLAAFQASPRLLSTAVQTIPNGLLDTGIRLADEQAPGDVLAARFILNMVFYVENIERNF